MSDLAILYELIKREAQVSLTTTSYGKRTAALEESTSQGDVQYSIEIKGIPNDAIVIKTDMFPAPDSTFTCQKGECKRADYVIIASSSKGNFILHIEMKRGRGRSREIVDQLKGSACFISYCQAIGRRFWRQPDFLGKKYKHRFVTIREIGTDRRPTVEKPQSGSNDSPQNALKIIGKASLHFRELVLR